MTDWTAINLRDWSKLDVFIPVSLSIAKNTMKTYFSLHLIVNKTLELVYQNALFWNEKKIKHFLTSLPKPYPIGPSILAPSALVEQLLSTSVLHVNFPVCKKERRYWIIKNFHFYTPDSISNNNLTNYMPTANSWKYNSHCMQLLISALSLVYVRFPALGAPGLLGYIFYPPPSGTLRI